MTVSTRQFEKIYNNIFLSFLKEGKIPTSQEVLAKSAELLSPFGSSIESIYKYLPQTSNAIFDIGIYNTAVDNISFDSNILFEELFELERASAQRIIYADMFNNLHTHQLKGLSEELNSLLFSLQGADDNFFGKFDNFSDTSKTNLDRSTNSIVNVHEGALSLPIAKGGLLKIELDHLYSTAATDIKLSLPVINHNRVPGTIFGNIFKDNVSPWGYIITTQNDTPVSISFTFRLKREEIINSISLLHYGDKPQLVQVHTSVDNVNKHAVDNYSDFTVLDSQSSLVSLDFEDRLVDYVHVLLTKNQADSEISDKDGNKLYQYIFGLKNISLFTTGRINKATYISKPFDFSNNLTAIGKISLDTNEVIPSNTNIRWSVTMVDDTGIENFLSIIPGAENFINLTDTLSNTKNIISDPTTFSNPFTFNSIKFWNIGTVDTEPVFGTASLLRGFRSWFRDKQGAFDTVAIKDNFIPFSKGDTQLLYRVSQEIKTLYAIGPTGDPAESQVTVITLVNNPLYDQNKGHFLVPPKEITAGIGVDKDTTPNYAIYNVSLNSNDILKTEAAVDVSGNDIDIKKAYMFYKSAGDIIIQLVDTTTLKVITQYIDGIDYIVKLDSDGFPVGIFDIVQGSVLSTASTIIDTRVDIVYNIDKNLTRFITSVDGNQIRLASIKDLVNEQLTIKYRHVPTNVLKASIKTKSEFGIKGEKKIFQQGVDYIFDHNSSTIQRLTTGTILSTDDVYVDFKFTDLIGGTEQFFLWALVSSPAGVEVETVANLSSTGVNANGLQPDSEVGESFSANVLGQGIIDLTDATKWPILKGWVQFIVNSKSPDPNNPGAVDHFINQVIKMKDTNGNFIFVQGGKYFSEMTGIRESLQQVSLPYLKTNVLKNDKRFFAVNKELSVETPEYRIYINFEPNKSQDLYRYTIDQVTGDLVSIKDEWKVNWTNKQSNDSFTKVIVKAELSKEVDVFQNVTPKAFGYVLKIGY